MKNSIYAIAAICIGLFMVVVAGWRISAAFRQGKFWGTGAVVFHESRTEEPVAFWSQVSLIAFSGFVGACFTGFGLWLIVR